MKYVSNCDAKLGQRWPVLPVNSGRAQRCTAYVGARSLRQLLLKLRELSREGLERGVRSAAVRAPLAVLQILALLRSSARAAAASRVRRSAAPAPRPVRPICREAASSVPCASAGQRSSCSWSSRSPAASWLAALPRRQRPACSAMARPNAAQNRQKLRIQM